MPKIIVTGSEGLIGRRLVKHLNKKYDVCCLDKILGHDLSSENFVVDFFSKNKADHLINLFAFNDHVDDFREPVTIMNLPLESFRMALDVNVTSLFCVCREFARNNPSSNIVNFAASTGIVSPRVDLYNGGHKHTGYSVSKAAVVHLTKILATHLAPQIRVNCISPGGVAAGQSDEFKNLYGSHTPSGRMMNVEELWPAIELCLDDKNSYMTGANIVVDGGWTLS